VREHVLDDRHLVVPPQEAPKQAVDLADAPPALGKRALGKRHERVPVAQQLGVRFARAPRVQEREVKDVADRREHGLLRVWASCRQLQK